MRAFATFSDLRFHETQQPITAKEGGGLVYRDGGTKEDD